MTRLGSDFVDITVTRTAGFGVTDLLPLGILLVCIVLIAVMFASLLRQGDERRQSVIDKASASSFAVLAAYLLLRAALSLVRSFQGGYSWQLDPLATLALAAVIYTAFLAFFKRISGK